MRLANPGAAMKTLPVVGYGQAHGYLCIHSAPRVMAKNIEWSLDEALGHPCNLKWSLQSLNPGGLRCELTWNGPIGTSSRLASALRGWHYLIFELHEVATQGGEDVMYMHTPELGLFHSTVGPHGDLLINENQIKRVLQENLSTSKIVEELENFVGKTWDNALEPFRLGREKSLAATDKLSV
ncbi:MAG: DUF3145 family protein [Actinobacteria bacterium]|nr:DUF3145 family protein [Actinomycetota bacterium]